MKTIGLFKAVFISALALTSISAHAEEKKWTKITIATEGAFRPYNFTKPDGSLDGYEVDLYKDLCARMKVECTMVAQPFDSIIPALNAGKFDAIMAGLTATPKREETISFSVSYGLTPQTFATLKDSPYAKYSWQNPDPDFKGGYGRQVLGETWVNHYGHHQVESTRGLIAPGVENHAIVRGVKDVWGPSDVYQLTTLHGDCQPVILGQVLKGMKPDDEPNPDKKLYPVAWTKSFTGTSGKPSRIFTTTMGHGDDLKNEGLRRLLVNACFWGLGMEDQIPAAANVDFVTPYDPVPIGYLKHKKGIKPADHKL